LACIYARLKYTHVTCMVGCPPRAKRPWWKTAFIFCFLLLQDKPLSAKTWKENKSQDENHRYILFVLYAGSVMLCVFFAFRFSKWPLLYIGRLSFANYFQVNTRKWTKWTCELGRLLTLYPSLLNFLWMFSTFRSLLYRSSSNASRPSSSYRQPRRDKGTVDAAV
jgi:hypothetical protein